MLYLNNFKIFESISNFKVDIENSILEIMEDDDYKIKISELVVGKKMYFNVSITYSDRKNSIRTNSMERQDGGSDPSKVLTESDVNKVFSRIEDKFDIVDWDLSQRHSKEKKYYTSKLSFKVISRENVESDDVHKKVELYIKVLSEMGFKQLKTKDSLKMSISTQDSLYSAKVDRKGNVIVPAGHTITKLSSELGEKLNINFTKILGLIDSNYSSSRYEGIHYYKDLNNNVYLYYAWPGSKVLYFEYKFPKKYKL